MNLHHHLIGFLSLCALAVSLDARADDFTESPVFTAIAGAWEGEGELTSSDGTVIPVREEWEGKKTGEGTFEMSGNRMMGEDSQEFRWVYSFNVATELVECVYWHTGMDEESVFQVTVSDQRVELRSPFGEPGGELIIINDVTEAGMTGLVRIIDPNGNEKLNGTVTHRKRSQ